jgi:hypothetical protein
MKFANKAHNITCRSSLVTVAMLCAAAGHASAAVINVPADQPTIQDAIVAAVNGDEIVVAPGSYGEQLDFLGKDIIVRSSGGATLTTIVGGSENAPLVRIASGETGATLEGFTLTGASNATGDGGAFEIIDSGATIRNCLVTLNTTTEFGGAGAAISGGTVTFTSTTFLSNASSNGNGSALLIVNGSDVTLNNCTVIGNGDASGSGVSGAIYVEGSVLSVNGGTFSGNFTSGGGLGGAISGILESTLNVSGAAFTGNQTPDGGSGGGIYADDSTITIATSTFSGNSGAIFAFDSSSTISSSVFAENFAEGAGGAGVSILDGTFSINACDFTANITDGAAGAHVSFESTSFGGTIGSVIDSSFEGGLSPGGSSNAINVTGGGSGGITNVSFDRCIISENGLDPDAGSSVVLLDRRSVTRFTNCLFTNNTGSGGAVRLLNNAQSDFINCTLVDNTPDAGDLTFLTAATSSLRVRNSIVRGRTDGNRRMFPPNQAAVTLTVSNSNVSGGITSPGASGIITSDPLFTDASSADYTLQASSPCIDAGVNSFVPSTITQDLGLGARIVGTSVDLGAYEFSPSTAGCDSIDFNNDSLFPDDSDLIDFLSVLAGGPCSNDPDCNDIDFNNDELFPDDSDLIAFLRVLAGGECFE